MTESSSSPHHSAKCLLFADAVRQYGQASIRVLGSSMTPAILPGDFLDVRKCRIDEARPGNVVAFLREDRIFAHRVINSFAEDGRQFLLTRGDALDHEDAPVSADDLLGIVVKCRRPNQWVLALHRWADLVRRSALRLTL